MIKLLQRAWRYLTALLTGKFNQLADPKVQLEQAIDEAQEQHRKLKAQAASVIANEKQTELRFERAREEQERVAASTQQALVMEAEARQSGDTAKADEYAHAAENLATRMMTIEEQITDLEELLVQARRATEQAKVAVDRNSQTLQQKIAEQQQLLNKLDQAKMQEKVNDAMSSLTSSVSSTEVPGFDEVREKIEQRQARAAGHAELQESSVEGRMFEVEQAMTNSRAQARLSEMRSKLGIAGALDAAPASPTTTETPSPAEPTRSPSASPATEPAPARDESASSEG